MLTVITGPMFSGKTSALISRAMAHVIAGDFVIAFKPKIDDRYDKENIITHHNNKFPAYPVNSANTAEECGRVIHNLIVEQKQNIDVILYDEAQFFDITIIDSIDAYMRWAHVIIAGLAQDSFGSPFGHMPTLLSMADNIVCLKAVCSKCKSINAATRTYRKTESRDQVVVGGIDMFEPRCFRCWNK